MRRQLTRVALVGAFAVSAAACGSDREESAPLPPPRPAAAQQAAAEPAPDPAENAVEAMVDDIDRQAFTYESRDPFMPKRPERGDYGDPNPVEVRECDLEMHPLGNTELSDLSMMALVTGTPLPRAMFVHRAGGLRAEIVTEGALAGPDCSNELVEIRDNEVVFEQKTSGGTAPVRSVLQLNEDRVTAQIFGD